ncbi:MAG: PilZ domain-containing protein [Novosphingobium sp.]
MLLKTATISTPKPATDRRKAPRRVITFGFDIVEAGSNQRILILDLSRTGLRLQTAANLAVGETIEVEIPEAGLVEARIMWRADDEFGAMFASPISQAAVSAVLLASPAHAADQDKEEIKAASGPRLQPGPAPDWLMWTVLTFSALVVALFIYAIGFLPISAHAPN